jgi:hypothetical protein
MSKILHCLPIMGLLILALLVGCGGGAGASSAQAPVLRVGTWNVYYGADLGGVVQALLLDEPEAVVAATTQAFATVQATDFARRAETIADEIVAHDLDLVGLQEAALWRTQSPADSIGPDSTPAQDVAFDFVALLLDRLAARGATYEVAVALDTLDAELPALDADGALLDVRLTDREVILVRRRGVFDGPAVQIDAVESGLYAAHLALPSGLPLPQGWAALEGRFDGRAFRFVSTHLEADVLEVRMAQIEELLAGPALQPLPTLLVGDFNADALSDGPGTPSGYALLVGGLHADAALGFPSVEAAATATRSAALDEPLDLLTQRVDLILVPADASFEVLDVGLLGAASQHFRGGLWPSDHLGVMAELRLP